MTLTTTTDFSPRIYSPEDVQLMRDTICKGSSDGDFKIFLMICQRMKLDPFTKQIYAVFRKDRKLNRDVMSVQTSIDGFRLIAERTGRYAPGRKPTFTYDKDGKLLSATAYVKKMTQDGTWHEIDSEAFWNEYVQYTSEGKVNTFWFSKPHVMLAKCAESVCLRKCFPQELSGVYTDDEMAQASNTIETIEEKPIYDENHIEQKTQELLLQFEEDDREFIKSYINKWATTNTKDFIDGVYHHLAPDKLNSLKDRLKVYKQKQIGGS